MEKKLCKKEIKILYIEDNSIYQAFLRAIITKIETEFQNIFISFESEFISEISCKNLSDYDLIFVDLSLRSDEIHYDWRLLVDYIQLHCSGVLFNMLGFYDDISVCSGFIKRLDIKVLSKHLSEKRLERKLSTIFSNVVLNRR